MELYIKSALEQLDKIAYYHGGEEGFSSTLPIPKKKRVRKPKTQQPSASTSTPSTPPVSSAPSALPVSQPVQQPQNWGLEPPAPKNNVQPQMSSQQPKVAPQQDFNTNASPYELSPTNEEIQSAKTPLDALEKNYHQVMQHVSVLAKQVHQDQQAALQLLQEFRNIRPAWKTLRETVRVNPSYASKINVQSVNQANQAFEQVLPMIAQMAMESKQDTVQISQFMNAAKSALGLIGQFVNVNNKAARSNFPTITVEKTSSSAIYDNN